VQLRIDELPSTVIMLYDLSVVMSVNRQFSAVAPFCRRAQIEWFTSQLPSGWRPGVLTQPLKYVRHFLVTWKALARRRPRVVFVQSPPTFAVWTVAAYAAVRGGAFVIDFHSDAFHRMRWSRPRWLNNFVARRAAMTLVTDAHWATVLTAAGARVTVLPDVPTDYQPAPGRHPGLHPERFNLQSWVL
jgi:hypothetical protein